MARRNKLERKLDEYNLQWNLLELLHHCSFSFTNSNFNEDYIMTTHAMIDLETLDVHPMR